MECQIKVTKGVEAGMDFRITAGETVLGKSPRAQVRLTHPSVSFEHAVILRNGDDYYLENLSSAGTILNNVRITGRVKLRAKDEIKLGPDTVVRVESTPGNSAPVNRRKLLVIATIASMALVLTILLTDPFGDSGDGFAWTTAYTRVMPYVENEEASKSLPAETSNLLREAWRMERAGDKKGASKMYVRLQVLLAQTEDKTQIGVLSSKYPNALGQLVGPAESAGKMDNDEMLAALHQFVNRRLRATSPKAVSGF